MPKSEAREKDAPQALVRKESRYQSMADTIVQLFISQACVLMARVERIQSESSQLGI